MPKKTKPIPDLEWENRIGHPDLIVVGVDEVGRGCLAGPVVAGAVVLPKVIDRKAHLWIDEVADSKLLSSEQRERLAPLIVAWVETFCVAQASVEEIDRINIFQASHLAMRRAIEGLKLKAQHVLVDGKFAPKGLPCPATAIIKGDQKSLSIACGSVLAKVWRDHLMQELDLKYPGYELGGHKGYSTPVHQEALMRLGPSAIHRMSFAPCKLALSRAAKNQSIQTENCFKTTPELFDLLDR